MHHEPQSLLPIPFVEHPHTTALPIPWILLLIVIALYIAVCFGRIAAKHGKNPWLFGILSIISPVNLIILGYWAFSGYETRVD